MPDDKSVTQVTKQISRPATIAVASILIMMLVGAGMVLNPVAAQKAPSATTPNRQVLRDDEVRQLLLLMDTDKNGKISRKEWMRFMEAEFDRLDKDKSGELDVHELAQSQLRPTLPPPVGK